eukprot:6433907-Ditylum_brightwellii.AAC.1
MSAAGAPPGFSFLIDLPGLVGVLSGFVVIPPVMIMNNRKEDGGLVSDYALETFGLITKRAKFVELIIPDGLI